MLEIYELFGCLFTFAFGFTFFNLFHEEAPNDRLFLRLMLLITCFVISGIQKLMTGFLHFAKQVLGLRHLVVGHKLLIVRFGDVMLEACLIVNRVYLVTGEPGCIFARLPCE